MGLSLESNIPTNPIEGKARKIQETAVIPSPRDAETNIPTNKRIPPRFLLANYKIQKLGKVWKYDFCIFIGICGEQDNEDTALHCTDLNHLQRAPVVVAGQVCQVGVASEEAASEASKRAREEDGEQRRGGRDRHHQPGEDAGHSRGYQQPPGSEDLLEEPSKYGHNDGWDVLGYSNPGFYGGSSFSGGFIEIVVLYQNSRERPHQATKVSNVKLMIWNMRKILKKLYPCLILLKSLW